MYFLLSDIFANFHLCNCLIYWASLYGRCHSCLNLPEWNSQNIWSWEYQSQCSPILYTWVKQNIYLSITCLYWQKFYSKLNVFTNGVFLNKKLVRNIIVILKKNHFYGKRCFNFGFQFSCFSKLLVLSLIKMKKKSLKF